MEYLILIILAVVVFYYFNKDEAEDKHDEANLEKFSDDYYKFLEKATSLKKEGDLEGAIKNIAKAISISPDITSVYKMAYYLHLDGQFDESWKVLMSHTTIIRELLFASDNWEKSNELLIEYVACEEGLIKLLKKQKKTKEVLYYSPAAEFYNLLTMATQYYSDFQETLKEHAKGSISERRKIKSNKYDLDAFDSKYKEFILKNTELIQQFSDYAFSSDLRYHLKDVDYDNNNGHNKSVKIIKKTKKTVAQSKIESVKMLKGIINKGIKLNDECYKAAEKN